MATPEIPEGLPRGGDVVVDKYRIERVVGLGGMGVVMEANLIQLDERVAIKFLMPELGASPEAIARFEREAKVLFKIKSQHVCRVYELGRLPNGVPFIVMEHLVGRDLAAGLTTNQLMPVDMAIGYVLQACHAVAEAHARGVVHRDLKPENFFVDEGHGEPCLKVLDFGLSKFSDHTDAGRRERQLTAQQQAMGTPQYMAPEQWVSATDAGPAADQWALGAILFELLTGRPPFDADDIGQICSKAMNAPTPSLHERRPDAPPGLDVVLRKCLEKHPSHRYENVGAFAVALAAFAPSDALEAAERLRAILETDNSGAWKPFALPIKMPSMPSDLRPTRRRVDKLEQNSWEKLLATVTGRRPLPLAFWITIASAVAAVLLLFVLLAIDTREPVDVSAEAAASAPPSLAPQTPAGIEEPTPEAPPASASAASSPKPVPRAAASALSTSAPSASAPSTSSGARPRSSTMFDERW